MVKAKPSVVQVGVMAAAAYCVMAGFIVLLVEWRSLPAIQPVLDELRSSVAGLLKIAILGWALKVWWEWRTRRQRLRFAIKVEVRTTLRNFKRIFTQANKDDLVRTLGREQRYIVTIIASPRFAIMSNLDDSISYLSPRLCRFVIAFIDQAGLIDAQFQFMRTAEFASFDDSRKIRFLEATWSLWPGLDRAGTRVIRLCEFPLESRWNRAFLAPAIRFLT